ncbi:MAG: hypothetical protein LIO93_09345 [Bacteroidales bacterium]|nr:hypothetical protein [Bacteroidales bacterium]
MYEDKGLTVTPVGDLNFGYVQVPKPGAKSNGATKILNVYASYTMEDDIEIINNYEAEGLLIHVPQDNWTDERGGGIEIFFILKEEKEYSLSITFKCGETEVVVPIKGIGAPNVPVETDTWYRLQFYQRTGSCLTDKGAENPLEVSPYDSQDDSQLWKFEFVKEVNGIDQFKMISKAGNQIKYRYADEENGITGRFLATPSSENTFSFEVREDGDWQIRWNQYETEDENGFPEVTGAHINKTNSDNEITAYNYMPDNGSAIKFHKENETIDIGLPEFSTETTSHWYFIQFKRVKDNKVIQSSDEVNTKLSQDVMDVNNELMHWKFVGDMNSCIIVDKNGNEWGTHSTNIVPAGSGDHYKFEGFGLKTWQLYNIDDVDNSSRYVNDFDNKGTEVGQWSANDAGAELIFTSVKSVGIDTPIVNEDESTIINRTYYTLQGVQLAKKPSNGIYIEKRTHESQKITSRKIYIPEN